MRAHARSASRGTTTRSSCSRASSEGSVRPYEVHLDGDARVAAATTTPGPRRRSTRASTSGGRVSSSAPAASAIPSGRPTRSRRPSTDWGSASTRCGRSPGGCNPDRRNGPTACCCSATRCTPTRPPSRRAHSSAPAATRAAPPGEQVSDFEEYAQLYREAWSDPDIRWLLATVPSTMIFDDHDVHDDWNISEAWVREMRATSWWDERIDGRVHVVLALPAHRQPGTARTGRRAAARGAHGRWRRRPAAARVRPRDRPGARGEPLRVPPRLRTLAPRRDRLACSARARRRPARHGRRRRVAMDRRSRARRLRPPHPREHPARLHDARHRRPRGLERGGLLGRVGPLRRRAPARSSAERSTSSTGRRFSARSGR